MLQPTSDRDFSTAGNSDLMQLFYDGQAGAFDELARRLQPSLIGQALKQLPVRHIARRETAEDLVQKALIKAVVTLDRPAIRWQSGKGSVRTWIGTILRNVVTSYLRSPASRQRVTCDFGSRADAGESVGIETMVADHRLAGDRMARESESHRRWLIEQVDRLPEKVQVVVQLKMAGQTHQEIAMEMGLSKSTVTYHFDTAKRILRSLAPAAAA